MKQIFILKENTKKIKDAKDVFKKIVKFKIDYTQENFIIFYLNTQNVITGSKNLFMGGVDSCVIDPKILFKKALINNASKLIIGHNHPSECLTPSYEDLEINEVLKKCGDMLGLPIIDNIIFNKKEYYSLNNQA